MDAVKRLRKEIKEIRKENSKSGADSDIVMHPDEASILNWNAFIRGPRDTPYEGGECVANCVRLDSIGRRVRVGDTVRWTTLPGRSTRYEVCDESLPPKCALQGECMLPE